MQALDFDDCDTAVESVSSLLLAKTRGTDDEPLTVMTPMDIGDAVREASRHLPSPAPDPPMIAQPFPTMPPPLPSPPAWVHAASTAQVPTMSASVATPPPLPVPQRPLTPITPGAFAHGTPYPPAIVSIPPSSVRRAFIASLRPEPPPPRRVRPWVIVGIATLAVLFVGAASIAFLAFPALFH